MSVNDNGRAVHEALRDGAGAELVRTRMFHSLYCAVRDALNRQDSAAAASASSSFPLIEGLTYGESRKVATVLAADFSASGEMPTLVEPCVEKLQEAATAISAASDTSYTFSVIIALYNVAEYLPALFASLEQQVDVIGPDDAVIGGAPGAAAPSVEYIFVDDCSTDGSLDMVTAWAAERANVTVFHHTVNMGVAMARSHGMSAAHGEWVTSVDPDDIIHPEYFARVFAFATAHPECHLLTTRLLLVNDADGTVTDNHPLGYKYRSGDRVVNLNESPTTIQLGATAFMRLSLIRANGLDYNYAIVPTFEDGDLIARYLLLAETPLVGLVSSAMYFYRKRTSGGSLVQGGLLRGEKYDDQLYHGYIGLLRSAASSASAAAHGGGVPAWVASTVLYDISWLFTQDLLNHSRTQWLQTHEDVRQRFLTHLSAIFAMIPPDTDPCRPLPDVVTSAWAQKYWGGTVTGTYPQRFFGEPFGHVEYSPPVTPTRYPQPLTLRENMWVRETITGSPAWATWGLAGVRRARFIGRKASGLGARVVKRLPAPTGLRGAWLVLDRPGGAGDNGEHFYRWLTAHTNENAYFVLRRGAPGWDRLEREGFRLLAYGSVQATRAYLNAAVVISSDAVVESRRLAPAYRYGDPGVPFVFLQHGVIYNKDIHAWLNPMDIALMITSTREEYTYITDATSPYRLGPDQVALTGLARFDRLVALPRSSSVVTSGGSGPITGGVVLMPTWAPGADYTVWVELAEALVTAGVGPVTFVLHPSLVAGDIPGLSSIGSGSSASFGSGASLRVVSVRDVDFQQLLRGTEVFITDYSSTQFDAAIAGCRVGFYQVDLWEGRALYPWKPLGPTMATPAQVLSWIRTGEDLPQTHRVPTADGHACERIYRAIRERVVGAAPPE
ncbi:MAG: glycosyltransferase [Corynebacterium sp.]|nr:glycosyltransferase [Corynebacterium sp.]